MSLVQLITPNPNIPCKPGWCLEYVAKAFGVFGQGVGQPSATAAWQYAVSTGTAHTDRNFDGLWVPVYFTFIGEPNGHIVVKAPDNSVYSASSSTSTTPVHHASIETLNSYYGGKLGLLGWSEDLNGIKIVKEGEIVYMTDKNYVTAFWIDLFGVAPTKAQLDQYVGKDWKVVYNELRNSAARKERLDFLEKLLKSNLATLDTALAKDTNAKITWIQALLNKIIK